MGMDSSKQINIILLSLKTKRFLLKLFLLCNFLLFFMATGVSVYCAFYNEPMQMYPERVNGLVISSPIPVVPGRGIPENIPLMRSINNVDLIKVGDSIFMGFRTAPTHFASPNAKLYVVRSDDEGKTWEEELYIEIGRDLREPRFLYFQNKLFLYFYTGGTHPLKFEPERIHFCLRQEKGQWTKPQPIYEEGYVVWRLRTFGDKAYMSVYYGKDIYGKGNRGDVRLLVSTDGIHWNPISPNPQIDLVGAEEAEFVFDENGGIVAIVRLEVGGGGLICKSPPKRIDCWECKFTPYKVDSSLMFTHNGRYFVIGRRNIAGRSARGSDLFPEGIRNAWSMLFYSLTRKRTCIYEINPENLELYPLIDLPSKGDTAFAGIVPISEDKYFLVNYSSSLNGPDLPWIWGQLLGSQLYGFILDFSNMK